ncbi:hypothetical protein QC763_0071510 [Podospora pseudopauciseta]|uniref:D-isomer specific 2-hydroxyacid dehydrogenase NAD-binding domain-containing protein n=1 Tax=Podospora pseudopauciseta TaxID=2093780 RepID=A0ABR0HEL7_9PEZI|nr:hypothetical protein QC763_0071510 [Podospora pseudopauciseta]
MFSANQTPEGFKKDTVRNVESTAKFVWNLATWDLREKVNASAQQFPFEVDEFEHVGLEKEFSSCLPGDVQNPVPMVRESPVKFECSYHSTLRLPGASVMGGVDLVIGKVEGVHIADWALSKEGKLDIGKTKPIARCGYYDYVVLDKTFEMVIPGGDKAILAGLEGNAEQARQSMGRPPDEQTLPLPKSRLRSGSDTGRQAPHVPLATAANDLFGNIDPSLTTFGKLSHRLPVSVYLMLQLPLRPCFYIFKSFAQPSLASITKTRAFSPSSPANMKLLYPTSLVLDPAKITGFPTLTLHPYDVKSPTLPSEHHDAEILVTWANSKDNLTYAVKNLKDLKWIQSLAAGPNDVLSAGFDASKVKITTGSGLHDKTVAEHALGLLLNAARRFYEMRDYQLQGKWPGHLGGPQPDREKGTFRTLRDARVTIWGFGNIAKSLTPHLVALGATVKGLARSKGVRDGIEVFGEDSLEDILKETDALVMILPGDASTKHALNRERLGYLPNHAWVVNVGRGTSIDEDALFEALEGEQIGGAALDVFETEPLPEGNKLYGAKNLILSPHAAGGRPQGAEELIVENMRKFLGGQELKNII